MVEAGPARGSQEYDLLPAWSAASAWRILDTRFGLGLRFLHSWQAWKNDPFRPQMLHYVALTGAPPAIDELLSAAAAFPELQALVSELVPQWCELLPGFHRLTLNGGQVLLTLCVGDMMAMLRAQQFVADSVYLDPDPVPGAAGEPWTVWTLKALARCCRRGTDLISTADSSVWRADLTQCGFDLVVGPTGTQTAPLRGQFNPRWAIKSSRAPSSPQAVAVGSCVVVGAGLAGASVAAALARRGWQVRVLDQGEAPAAGASGLPVGLVVPHVSTDDCALSRLSRAGMRLMLQQARSLLRQGQDWDATGTQERQVDGAPGMPPIWHAQAAWLKPAQMVRAWLAQPGVTFQGGAQVAALRPSGDEWELLDAQSHCLARASRVVLANAHGVLTLLDGLQAARPALRLHQDDLPLMHGVRGQLSWAMHPGIPDAAFPAFPVNGAGSVIPVVPVEGGTAWFIGSSYQPSSLPASPDEKNHAANLGRLHQLLPELAHVLAPQFASGRINAWKGTRCVTADRLPMVGPLYQADNPTLWICAGMGSRGLSFSVLCAELLAARWGAEPLPLDAGLARSLNARRASRRLPDQA